MLTGTDELVALELVTKAKNALANSVLLYKDFSTAQEIIDRRKNLLKCSSIRNSVYKFLTLPIFTNTTTGKFAK
jgi:hypothetical protein